MDRDLFVIVLAIEAITGLDAGRNYIQLSDKTEYKQNLEKWNRKQKYHYSYSNLAY